MNVIRNSSCCGSLGFSLNLDDSLDILVSRGKSRNYKPFSLYFFIILSGVKKIEFFFLENINSGGRSRRQLQAINMVKDQNVRTKMTKQGLCHSFHKFSCKPLQLNFVWSLQGLDMTQDLFPICHKSAEAQRSQMRKIFPKGSFLNWWEVIPVTQSWVSEALIGNHQAFVTVPSISSWESCLIHCEFWWIAC